MNHKKILLMAGLIAMFALLVPAGQVLAGGDPPISADLGAGSIQGPELWGVIVMDCSTTGSAPVTLRVKRIVDCNVETAATVGFFFNCPNVASDIPANALLTGISLFDISGTPVITKVKNFNRQGDACSFDVQIKFYN